MVSSSPILAAVTANESLEDGVFYLFVSGCLLQKIVALSSRAHQLIAAVSQLAGSLINLASVPLLRPISTIICTTSHIICLILEGKFQKDTNTQTGLN